MSRYIAKMNLISAVQSLPKKDVECVQDYVEMIEDENTKFKEKEDDLIKYLEDKISHLKQCQTMALESRYKEEARDFNLRIADFQDILERLKSGKYE